VAKCGARHAAVNQRNYFASERLTLTKSRRQNLRNNLQKITCACYSSRLTKHYFPSGRQYFVRQIPRWRSATQANEASAWSALPFKRYPPSDSTERMPLESWEMSLKRRDLSNATRPDLKPIILQVTVLKRCDLSDAKRDSKCYSSGRCDYPMHGF